jgi:hypothetical protein
MNKKWSLAIIILVLLHGFGTSALSGAITSLNTQSTDQYDMVIIAPNGFSDELQPLIDHKNAINLSTTIKTIEDIYLEYPGRDKSEQIKYFIKDALDQWNITFVLLVGGANQLPTLISQSFGNRYL